MNKITKINENQTCQQEGHVNKSDIYFINFNIQPIVKLNDEKRKLKFVNHL